MVKLWQKQCRKWRLLIFIKELINIGPAGLKILTALHMENTKPTTASCRFFIAYPSKSKLFSDTP